MLTAVHTLIYTDDAPATRAFLLDVLRWPCVSEGGRGDDGHGADGDTGSRDPNDWLIFSTGPSEMGVHPTAEGTSYAARHHEIALMCDDITATIAELRGRGAEFSTEPTDMGFGIGVMLQVPGADDILLYEPKHVTAYDHP